MQNEDLNDKKSKFKKKKKNFNFFNIEINFIQDKNNEQHNSITAKEAAIDVSSSSFSRRSPSPNPLNQTQMSSSSVFKSQTSSISLPPNSNNSTIQYVQNTSQRIQQKLYYSFRRSNNPTITTTNTEATTYPPPPPPLSVTHLASVNALLDFYCSIAENCVILLKIIKFLNDS